MSEEKPENNDLPPDENTGAAEESSEADISDAKKKLKDLGLEDASKAGFANLMMHKKPPERKSDKKPFMF